MFNFKAVRSLEEAVDGEEVADSAILVRPLICSVGAFGGEGGAILASAVRIWAVRKGRPAAPLRVSETCETITIVT